MRVCESFPASQDLLQLIKDLIIEHLQNLKMSFGDYFYFSGANKK
jgi:hypothetical protein